MHSVTDLLQILLTNNTQVGNTYEQRELLQKIAHNTHFHLCTVPFERTDVSTFKKIRSEFNDAIRPVFLKYLVKVESRFISSHFSPEEHDKMAQGYLPFGWTVHHQKSISCGGLNMAKEYYPRIRKMTLTPDEMVLLPEDVEKQANYILACQLNRFLAVKEKSGSLTSTFYKMFQRYLILLPQALHQALEDSFLTPQKKQLSFGGDLSEQKMFHFPLSPLLIYGGERHLFGDALKPRTVYRYKDDSLPLMTAHQYHHLR